MVTALLWILQAIVSFTANTGKQITIEVLKFAATRALLLALVFVVFPVIIYNVFGDLIVDFVFWGLGELSGYDLGSFNTVLMLSGMGGWIAQQIDLGGILGIFLGCCSIKIDLKLVSLAWKMRQTALFSGI